MKYIQQKKIIQLQFFKNIFVRIHAIHTKRERKLPLISLARSILYYFEKAIRWIHLMLLIIKINFVKVSIHIFEGVCMTLWKANKIRMNE